MKIASHWFLLVIVLIAFAANSLFCRLALKLAPGQETLSIDPASFTSIRLISGALVLSLLLFFSGKHKQIMKPSALHFRGAIFLFLYAVTFSFAYISLDAAMGALILFGVVQISIISISIVNGNRLSALEWFGSTLAVIGLLVLTMPHLLQSQTNSAAISVLLMVISGIAWGLFTLNGSGSKDSLLDTSNCFVLTVPVAGILLLLTFFWQGINISAYGLILAVLSGALASGMGYALWYHILPKLTPSQASTSQLSVPVIAATGGSLFLGESLNLLFILASGLILGGVLLVIKTSTTRQKAK